MLARGGVVLKHRSVTEQDLDVICQFPNDKMELFNMFPAATFPLDPKQLTKAINDRYASTVFLLDDMIVGFANYYSVQEGKCGSIGNVIVSPDHRAKGIGKQIIEVMVEIGIKQYSLMEIYIACMSENIPALLLYTNAGFKPVNIDSLINPVGKRIPRIHLVYKLPSARD